MLVGNSERFAVVSEINDSFDGWVLGSFYFLINGIVVGNQYDVTVDLKGCLRWILDFLENSKPRYEPGLFDMGKKNVYLVLASSVLENENKNNFVKESYQNTFLRFHISHIGMSSFDLVTLLFMKNESGMERLVWKDGENEVMDAYLECGEIEQVLSTFAGLLEDAIFQNL